MKKIFFMFLLSSYVGLHGASASAAAASSSSSADAKITVAAAASAAVSANSSSSAAASSTSTSAASPSTTGAKHYSSATGLYYYDQAGKPLTVITSADWESWKKGIQKAAGGQGVFMSPGNFGFAIVG